MTGKLATAITIVRIFQPSRLQDWEQAFPEVAFPEGRNCLGVDGVLRSHSEVVDRVAYQDDPLAEAVLVFPDWGDSPVAGAHIHLEVEVLAQEGMDDRLEEGRFGIPQAEVDDYQA